MVAGQPARLRQWECSLRNFVLVTIEAIVMVVTVYSILTIYLDIVVQF